MNKYYLVVARLSSRQLLLAPEKQTITVMITKRWAKAAADNKDAFSEEEKTTETAKEDESMESISSIVPDLEENALRQQKEHEYIERSRDVSRFSKIQSKWKQCNQVPDLTKLKYGEDLLNNGSYFRRLYARLGRASGVDPSVAWPTKAKLDEIIAFEKEYELTFEKKVQMLIERKNQEFEQHQKLFVMIFLKLKVLSLISSKGYFL